MEEDKRKATERETARQARDQLLRSRRQQEADALTGPGDPLRPDKSKFVSARVCLIVGSEQLPVAGQLLPCRRAGDAL